MTDDFLMHKQCAKLLPWSHCEATWVALKWVTEREKCIYNLILNQKARLGEVIRQKEKKKKEMETWGIEPQTFSTLAQRNLNANEMLYH